MHLLQTTVQLERIKPKSRFHQNLNLVYEIIIAHFHAAVVLAGSTAVVVLAGSVTAVAFP